MSIGGPVWMLGILGGYWGPWVDIGGPGWILEGLGGYWGPWVDIGGPGWMVEVGVPSHHGPSA